MIIPIKIHNHIFVPKSIWKKRDIDYSISQQLGEASIMQHAFTCPTKVDETSYYRIVKDQSPEDTLQLQDHATNKVN